ncbi:GrpB family protein [Variovorax sp. DT-64]|uniref:GrpB family protein n=1 Tax=Variovorax sp. DT-64 TaxID=3396160 RepID=UPI003F1DD1C4
MKCSVPQPFIVELLPHDPRWKDLAATEITALETAAGSCLRAVHHIGSTAIAGIRAKPILDLMPEVESLAVLDQLQDELEAIGYEWWGALGLPGRRYCTKTDPITGRRSVQLHCYETGSAEITRHLAFRDYLREHPAIAAEYDREKAHCQKQHPANSHAYGDCKDAWIKRTEARALRYFA